MNINFTVIVQAFNFLITYLILRHLLFRPAVTVVQEEKMHESSLKISINESKQAYKLLAENNQRQWKLYQREFLTQTPNVFLSDLFIYQGIASQIKAPIIADNEIKTIEQTMSQAIIKKVERAL